MVAPTVDAVDVPQHKAVAGDRAWRRLLQRPGGAVAVASLAVMLVSAIFAPLFAPYSPIELGVGPPQQGPSSAHLFGTDELGRDLFSRTLYGGRVALGITALATVIALLTGTVWGALAAIVGGWLDDLLMRIVDATIAVPFLMLALILVAATGASTFSLALILGAVTVPWTARVMRVAFLEELHLEYVSAAKAFGMSRLRLVLSELLPNVVPTMLVQGSLIAASVLMAEAAIGFVGLGVQPPDASWGTLLQDGYENINVTPIQIVFPGLMMFITIWAITALADQLQAVLDVTDRARPDVRA